MSMLVRAVALKHFTLSATRAISSSSQKLALHNYEDFKPGRVPKTREEIAAAAKKYNLLPSEYEPYPDDGLGRGDYPKLPDISVEDRDPFYPWDDPVHKRNFGEPVHAHIDLICEERYHISMRPRFSNRVMIASFLGVMTTLIGITLLMEPYPMFRPVLEKQIPRAGVVHYTFETTDVAGSDWSFDSLVLNVNHSSPVRGDGALAGL